MRVITGDECGLLKECLPNLAGNGSGSNKISVDKGVDRLNGPSVGRDRGVVGLAWTSDDDDRQFASLHLDGSLQLWSRTNFDSPRSFGKYRPQLELTNIFDPKATEPPTIHPATRPLALEALKAGSNRLVACNGSGSLSILQIPAATDDGSSLEASVVQTFSSVKGNAQPSQKQSVVTTPNLISALAIHKSNNWAVTGGRDRESTVWDLETAQPTWKAKNLPPDPQTLLQPLVWPTSLLFLENKSSLGDNVLVMGSAHAEVRVYDVRANQRRPLCLTPKGLLEHRITTLCAMGKDSVVVGDSAGSLLTVDLRCLGKDPKDLVGSKTAVTGRWVGPTGSVRGLQKHATLPRLASVGLDRMLRIYDTASRQQVSCLYLKQRLNCVLVGSEVDAESTVNDPNAVYNPDQVDLVQDYVESDKEDDEGEFEGSGDSDGESNASEDVDDSESDDSSEEEDDEAFDNPRKKSRR